MKLVAIVFVVSVCFMQFSNGDENVDSQVCVANSGNTVRKMIKTSVENIIRQVFIGQLI